MVHVRCPAGPADSSPGCSDESRAHQARARVAVIFLTGHPERFREATENKLRSAGYEWTGVILKPDAMRTTSAVEQKAAERTIAVNVGFVP